MRPDPQHVKDADIVSGSSVAFRRSIGKEEVCPNGLRDRHIQARMSMVEALCGITPLAATKPH
jgi:hypothetical protein